MKYAARPSTREAALASGDSIYMEGGDTWCYDEQRTMLNPWFGVREVARGGGLSNLGHRTGRRSERLGVKTLKQLIRVISEFLNDRVDHLFVDPHGTGKRLASMHNAMSHSTDLGQIVKRVVFGTHQAF